MRRGKDCDAILITRIFGEEKEKLRKGGKSILLHILSTPTFARSLEFARDRRKGRKGKWGRDIKKKKKRRRNPSRTIEEPFNEANRLDTLGSQPSRSVNYARPVSSVNRRSFTKLRQ